MVAVYMRLERVRDKSLWEKCAYLAMYVANSSGMRKRALSFREVMPRFKDDYQPVDIEQRRREAMETFRFHKQKFWTLIGGGSLDDIQVEIPEADIKTKLNGDN